MNMTKIQNTFRYWAIGRIVSYNGQQCKVVGVDNDLRLLLDVPGLTAVIAVRQFDVDFNL
jgi:hypothetical protein